MDGVITLDSNLTQNKWDIVGHEWAVELLRGQIQRTHNGDSGVSHAYLLCGTKGVGRRTLALQFASALNCLAPLEVGVPCGKCRACRQFKEMKHPDLSVLQAEQEFGTLKVEQVRDFQRQLILAPYEAHYRIGLLLRFEEAHPSAANALLKVLEEPPPHVILILTADNSEALLPTIVSRCQVMRLNRLPLNKLAYALQSKWDVDAEHSCNLAHISGGCPGQAVRFLQDPTKLERRNTWLDEFQYLLSAGRVERFNYAADIADFKGKDPQKKNSMLEELQEILNTWLSYGRDILLFTCGYHEKQNSFTNLERWDQISTIARQLNPRMARDMVSVIEHCIHRLDRNVNARMAAEALLLELPLINL